MKIKLNITILVGILLTGLPNLNISQALATGINSIYPTLGELGTNLNVTIQGSGFDNNTRLSMYPDTGNKAKIISSLSTWGFDYDVAVINNIAYVADFNQGLKLIDVSDPAQPHLIGTVETPGTAVGIAVFNNIAYVADGSSGLQVVDVDPLSPDYLIIIGSVDTPDSAGNVTVINNIAYVADGGSGLQVVDLSNPTQPVIIGLVDTPGSAESVAVINDIAYVADYYSGLQIINVSDPAQPVIIGSVDKSDSAESITVINNIAYVGGGRSLKVVDVSDPEAPVSLGSVETPGSIWDVAVINDIAYVADRGSGLQIINVSDPPQPTIIGSVETPGYAFGVTVINDIAYVADGSSGLHVIDVSNPTPPILIGSVETPGGGLAVHVINDIAYVANGTGLQVIDIGNHMQPVIIGAVETPGSARSVTVIDDIAYVADYYSGLQIINVSNPTQPFIIGAVETPYRPDDVTVINNIAYVADGTSGLQVVDVDPQSLNYLQIIGSVDTPTYAYGVTVNNDIAYVADGSSGLQIINVSDPGQPTIIGSVDTPEYAEDVFVINDIAYVAGHNSGLQIINVSDPTHPVIISWIDTPNYAHCVTVINGIAYVADDISGIQVIDVSDPTQPINIGSVDTPGAAYGVSVNNDIAYVADGFGGSLIIIPVPIEITDLTVNSNTEITATLSSPQLAGNYTLRVFDNTQYVELPGAVTFTENTNLLHSRAIIIAGGGPDAPGDIWEETKAYAREAYNALLYQGYTAENIYYMTDEGTAEGRDAAASWSNFQYAITNWVDDNPETTSLVLYMVDHGENERFLLRGYSDPTLSEYVTAEELDFWLDTLQANTSIKVLVVYDACRSGSFITKLRESGNTRVVISSTDDNEVAYFLDLKQSFSGIFWSIFSGKTGKKGTLYNAWNLAEGNMINYQFAQLDANGNGVANEPEDTDALEQNIFEIGREWFNVDLSRPVINIVADDQVLNGDVSAILAARGVYDPNNDSILRVWAEIINPDYVPPSDVTITSLPSVDLTGPDENGSYSYLYNGFTVNGTYIINYYAEDNSGTYSLQKTSLVTQTEGTSVQVPDQYEDDDTAADAKVIVLNDPSSQEHSFHDSSDEDWVMFYGIEGEVYNVKASNPTLISDPAISIYSSGDLTTPLVTRNNADAGSQELLKNWICPEDGVYYVRLTNNSPHYGANVRYKLKVYNPIAFSLPGYVKGKITSGGEGIGGVVLRSSSGSGLSKSDGTYLLSLESGKTQSVNVSKAGYQSASFSITLSQGDTQTRNIELTSLNTNSPPTISGNPPTLANTNELYTFTPATSDPDGDPLSFSITNPPAWANFNSSTGTLFGIPTSEGSYGPITIMVSDGQENVSLSAFTITVIPGSNLPPVITGSPQKVVGADRMYSFTPLVSDPNGDSLSLSISSKPGWASFTGGRLFGIPGEVNLGTYGPITITVKDSKGASASLVFYIEVVPGSEIDKLGFLQGVYMLLRE